MTSTTGPSRPSRSSDGFTLVELLTVLAIFAVLMGIAWAGVIGSRRSAGLTGAAEMIAGFARQARSTALSTGAPVQIIIDKDARTVAGVSQTPVFELSFDTKEDPYQMIGKQPGFSGYGWVIDHPDDSRPPGELVFRRDEPSISLADQARPLRKSHPLMRKAGDGFYISCWFKPPPITSGMTPMQLPIILIGEDDTLYPHLAALPLTGSEPPPALIGLKLELETLTFYEDPAKPNHTIQTKHWSPVAWLRHGSTAAETTAAYGVASSGIEAHPSVATLGVLGEEVSSPILGGRWIELGLLYDGQDLVLLRSGIEIDRASDIAFPPPSSIPTVFFGRGKETTGSSLRGAGMIDEIRIVRIGSDRPQLLPAGLELAHHYRITNIAGSASLSHRDDPSQSWTTYGINDSEASSASKIVLRSTTEPKEAVITLFADGSTAVTYRNTP